MIKRLASIYIKNINFDTRETRDEIKKVVRLRFIDFCQKNGVENTIEAYRGYRSVVRAVFGFDLMGVRPKNKMDNSVVEHDIELF